MAVSWKAKLALAAVLAAPAVVLRLAGVVLTDPLALLVFGGGVVAAACILAWAAEAAEVDIAGSLAVALLALIAVLPEFAVDLYFAFTAGHRPSYAAYAAANMTGSNRLLIGFGWSLAAIVFIVGARRRGCPPGGAGPWSCCCSCSRPRWCWPPPGRSRRRSSAPAATWASTSSCWSSGWRRSPRRPPSWWWPPCSPGAAAAARRWGRCCRPRSTSGRCWWGRCRSPTWWAGAAGAYRSTTARTPSSC